MRREKRIEFLMRKLFIPSRLARGKNLLKETVNIQDQLHKL
jgi:hypothetical protein